MRAVVQLRKLDRLQASIGPIAMTGGKSLSMLAAMPRLDVEGLGVNPAGGTYYYQCFYRNTAPAFCPPATSNRTNGVAITWAP